MQEQNTKAGFKDGDRADSGFHKALFHCSSVPTEELESSTDLSSYRKASLNPAVE